MAQNLKSLLDVRGLKLRDLASGASVDASTVTRWAQRRIPAGRVLDVERITGISRHELRPDVFGAKPHEAAA